MVSHENCIHNSIMETKHITQGNCSNAMFNDTLNVFVQLYIYTRYLDLDNVVCTQSAVTHHDLYNLKLIKLGFLLLMHHATVCTH